MAYFKSELGQRPLVPPEAPAPPEVSRDGEKEPRLFAAGLGACPRPPPSGYAARQEPLPAADGEPQPVACPLCQARLSAPDPRGVCQCAGRCGARPEGAWAFFAGSQLARRYGLPYRGSGGLNTAKSNDAQAMVESQWCLWPTVLGHTNWVQHAAGWLESGLVCSYEKLILDAESLAMMQHLFGGVEVSPATLAFESIQAVGPGGHHFGTEHTIARYESEFYRPIVGERLSIGQWEDAGRIEAPQRANRVWKELLANYERPPIDPGVEQELNEFVDQRKKELT